MPPRHLLGVTTVRRRYTTLNGRLRYHWTGERVLTGKPTVFAHRWEDVLHQLNGEAHDFEGFGVPAWTYWADDRDLRIERTWRLAWPCLACGSLVIVPASHRCDR
jgi:hypothetical protein